MKYTNHANIEVIYPNKNDQLHTCKVKEMLHVTYGSGNGSIKFNLIWSSMPDMMISVIK